MAVKKIFDITFFEKDGQLHIKDESCGCCGSTGLLTRKKLDELVEEMESAVTYLKDNRNKSI